MCTCTAHTRVISLFTYSHALYPHTDNKQHSQIQYNMKQYSTEHVYTHNTQAIKHTTQHNQTHNTTKHTTHHQTHNTHTTHTPPKFYPHPHLHTPTHTPTYTSTHTLQHTTGAYYTTGLILPSLRYTATQTTAGLCISQHDV